MERSLSTGGRAGEQPAAWLREPARVGFVAQARESLLEEMVAIIRKSHAASSRRRASRSCRIGIDANPHAALISRAKTAPLTFDDWKPIAAPASRRT